jgi:hypothetical protein
VDYLRNCPSSRIRKVLADVPKTLDETYARVLREIKESHQEFAQMIFQCVAVASRPLRVKELAEVFAFDFEAGEIPEFREDWREDDPVHASAVSMFKFACGRQCRRYRSDTIFTFLGEGVLDFGALSPKQMTPFPATIFL